MRDDDARRMINSAADQARMMEAFKPTTRMVPPQPRIIRGKAATVVIDEAAGAVSIHPNMHPARRHGMTAGMVAAGGRQPNEEIYVQVIDAVLTSLLEEREDDTPTPEHEASYENLCGFVEGFAKMMEVKPLLFLTRAQTAHVEALPRPIKLAWRAEYRRSVKKWKRAGGALSGKRPVLPSIPGDPTAAPSEPQGDQR